MAPESLKTWARTYRGSIRRMQETIEEFRLLESGYLDEAEVSISNVEYDRYSKILLE